MRLLQAFLSPFDKGETATRGARRAIAQLQQATRVGAGAEGDLYKT